MKTLSAPVNIATDKVQIEETLSGLLPPDANAVARAMRYATLGQAQRLRPLLALRVSRTLSGGERDHLLALPAAAAVELLHCASLIVDDLPSMDNSPMRRNRESAHVRYGEATALLAAFGLVALAARAASSNICFQTKLLSTLAYDSLIGGQALDLGLDSASRQRLGVHVAALKTVPLFVLAAEAGCLSSGILPEHKRAAVDFAREFGLCYQMLDDLLDGETQDEDGVRCQLARTRAYLDAFPSPALELDEMLTNLDDKLSANHRRSR